MKRWGILRAGVAALVLAGAGCASSRRREHGARRRAGGAATGRGRQRKADPAVADAAAARAAAEAAAKDAREANEKADRIFQRSLHK